MRSMPSESSRTGRVTMREMNPASTSTTASANRNTPSIWSRMEVSESTVSCTEVTSTSAPVRCPPRQSAAQKHPTQIWFRSRPLSLSSTEAACRRPSPSC